MEETPPPSAAPAPAPPRKTRRWRPELLFSIASLVVSMCAFGAAALQTYLMQRQQHAAVWPFLELGVAISGEAGFEVRLTNKGVGPAIIKEVDLYYRGQRYDRLEKIAQLIVKDSAFDYRYFSTSPPDGRVYAQSESVVIFSVKNEGYATRLIQAADQIHVRIRYASVFGQEWEREDGQVLPVD
jgi:hypothetical protein